VAGQHHHHDHGHDWGARAAELEFEGELSLSWAPGAMAWLAERLPEPGRILDLGAGPGVFTTALATAFPAARVTAVDNAPELLEHAQRRAASLGLTGRVAVEAADLGGNLGALPEADLVWAGRVLHHVPDHAATLAVIAARLRPGGMLALVEGGLATRFLPSECGIGEPGLMSRVDARIATALAGEGTPRAYNWDVLLTEAGLAGARSRSFLLDVPAPVSPEVREWAAGRIAHAAEWVGEELDVVDRDALRRLVDPDEPLGVHRRPDLFVLGASTVHAARRPE
jgi:SAM-dependent methyltransferase